MARALVNNGLRLSIHALAGKQVKPGVQSVAGIWQWTFDGKSGPSISFMITVQGAAAERANLRLSYSDDGQPIDYSIPLVSDACRFGGRRWYAICPRTGRKVSKLYKPTGSQYFFARKAWKLAYRSQRTTAGMNRLCSQRDRILFQKLKSDDPELPIKPKWMRWKTYDRHFGKIEDLHQKMDAELAWCVGKLGNLSI